MAVLRIRPLPAQTVPVYHALVSFLTYWFYPNPGNADYGNPKVQLLLALCVLLMAGAVGIRFWRNRQPNPITKKLSRSWAVASLWFGIVALVLTVSRVEQIQFFAMRFLWALWVIALVAYIILQVRVFRARHYQVLPRETVVDPRDPYLPGKKRR